MATTQRAAAMAAFQQKAEEANKEPESASSTGQLSARELAMRNLGRKGVTATSGGPATGKGVAGALKNLGIDEGAATAKVVPNWKQTSGQKNAAAARAEIKGSGAASARDLFKGMQQTTDTAASPAAPAGRPWAKSSPNPSPHTSFAAASVPKPTAASTPVAASASAAGGGANEAAELVDHDLNLLIEGLKRLGSKEPDGSVVALFVKLVDDEILEQQLESLVGTLKAGRRRGVLEWKGQMLLKGPHDNEPIKLVSTATAAPAAATPEPAAVVEATPAEAAGVNEEGEKPELN